MVSIENIKTKFNNIEMYNVFSGCMYMPTLEKFKLKANEYIDSPLIHIFGYYENNCIVGIIVVEQKQDGSSEIKGIAVDLKYRKNGIGSKLIQHVCNKLSLFVLTAETDDDAVNFYRHCGFDITEFVRNGDNGKFKRYNCVLNT